MNPYDPNDALSDHSVEYSSGNNLSTIQEFPEDIQLEEISIELEHMRATISQECDEATIGVDLLNMEDFNYASINLKDPNNEFDSEGGSSGEYNDGKVINEILQKYINESETVTQLSNTNNTIKNSEACLEEINVISKEVSVSGSESKTNELKKNESKELKDILEEAKTLFQTPEKSEIKIVDPTAACPKSSSGMELLEIESKLRECHLMKSQSFNKKESKQSQLVLQDKCSKTEEPLPETPTTQTSENFCELLYKSTLMSNADTVNFLQNVKKEQKTQTEQTSSSNTVNSRKSTHIDDYAVLSRAVKLLECRNSLQSVPNNCRGILGILALQEKLKELFSNKEELESRLYKCNSDFMEFIEILSDKARIISINNKEVANFIKILNLKVPELEKITASHTESLEDIKYRFKERNVAKIIELRKQIEFYNLNINKLNKKIAKMNSENAETKRQIDSLDIDNLNYKTYFTKKVEEVRANMENLQSLNNDLQCQLELVQNSDVVKSANFQLKVPSLKEEIENIANNMKEVRRDKNKFELENTELRKKLKQLILAKVLEKRNTESSVA